MYLNMNTNCPEKCLVGLKFWSSWEVAPMVFKIRRLSRHFQKGYFEIVQLFISYSKKW